MRFCERMGPCGPSYPMGDETEFLMRLKQKGCLMIYVPSARVEHIVHESQSDEAWLLRRAFNYGRALPHVRPRPGNYRILGAPVSIYYDYVARVIGHWTRAKGEEPGLISRVSLQIIRGEWREFRELARRPCERPSCGEGECERKFQATGQAEKRATNEDLWS